MPRYARQVALPEVGPAGQEKLAQARVVIIGAGGLGCPVAQYLAAAGVGELVIIDPDVVDESNLHRQILYTPGDVGKPKASVAAERLQQLAPECGITCHQVAFGADNASKLLAGATMAIDGTDRLPVRYAIDDACNAAGIPWVHGAISRFEGQVAVFGTDGPGYRDLWPKAPDTPPPNCAEEGVIGPLPGVIGSWQATEAILHICNPGRARHLLLLDLLAGSVEKIELRPAKQETPLEILPGKVAGDWTILDVREPEEYGMGQLLGAVQIPMHQVPDHVDELRGHAQLLVHCAHGMRSLHIAHFLRQQGVNATSFRGTVDQLATSLGRPLE